MEKTRRVITDKEIEIFRKVLICAEKSDNTVEKYIRDIRKFKNYTAGKEVTSKIVFDYKAALEKCGKYKISSINSFLVVLNHFCRVMGWSDLCVKTIKVQAMAFEMEDKELTMPEYKKLIHTAMETGDELIALILQTIGSTGIRISELKYIRVEDLSCGVADVHNKGKVRRILLPSSLTKILKAYAEKNHIVKGVLFYNKNKQPIDRKNVWRQMKRIARLAGISEKKVYPHNLRHLFAKEFYKQTGDIMKLADILGHSNVNTTRIYIRTTGREHKKQMDEMNMVLQKRPDEKVKCFYPHTNADTMLLLLPDMIQSNYVQTSMVGKMCEIKIQIPIQEIFRKTLMEECDE